MQEKMGNVSMEMGTQRTNQKEMLEIINTVIEMKNVFDWLISRGSWSSASSDTADSAGIH